MTSLLLLALPALASPDTAEALSAWSTRTGIALASVPEVHAQPGSDGSMVVAGRGTSLVLQLEASPEELLATQVAPFAAAGIAEPTWTAVACTVAGEATTCLTGRLEVAPGATMRLLAGRSPTDGYTAACLDRRGSEAWPAPCQGVIGQ